MQPERGMHPIPRSTFYTWHPDDKEVQPVQNALSSETSACRAPDANFFTGFNATALGTVRGRTDCGPVHRLGVVVVGHYHYR